MRLRRISWEEMFNALKEIVSRIPKDYYVVVGIGSSGLIPASIVCKLLKCREFYTLSIKLYDEGKPPRRISEKPLVLAQFIPDLSGRKVILVDDLASSGETMRTAKQIIKRAGASEVISIVLVKKRKCKEKIDYFYLETDDCPIFPWDSS